MRPDNQEVRRVLFRCSNDTDERVGENDPSVAGHAIHVFECGGLFAEQLPGDGSLAVHNPHRLIVINDMDK
ncbi:hypothetical protein LCGC14_0212370 [marine sediment metagenome]|uniref:Uncharacterized protein n=1 Tax=marine sediment metagenome TaxID=412755 RepID=A0A0F9WZN6_9ZZZZ